MILPGTFILKLEGPLASPQKIQEIATLSSPTLSQGVGEDSETTFCEMDRLTRHRVSRYLAKNHPGFRPTFIRLAKAKKDLSADSITPFLGLETTLPQYRPHEYAPEQIKPAQAEYPVWYFFYGTLTSPNIRSKQLNFEPSVCDEQYRPAHVAGGRLRTWGMEVYGASG